MTKEQVKQLILEMVKESRDMSYAQIAKELNYKKIPRYSPIKENILHSQWDKKSISAFLIQNGVYRQKKVRHEKSFGKTEERRLIDEYDKTIEMLEDVMTSNIQQRTKVKIVKLIAKSF